MGALGWLWGANKPQFPICANGIGSGPIIKIPGALGGRAPGRTRVAEMRSSESASRCLTVTSYQHWRH
jgi:hypothetical protein